MPQYPCPYNNVSSDSDTSDSEDETLPPYSVFDPNQCAIFIEDFLIDEFGFPESIEPYELYNFQKILNFIGFDLNNVDINNEGRISRVTKIPFCKPRNILDTLDDAVNQVYCF